MEFFSFKVHEMTRRKNFYIKSLLFFYVSISSFPLSFNFSYAEQSGSKAQLEAELKRLESEMQNQKQAIEQKKKEGVSLQRDISVLDGQIQNKETEIKKRDFYIKNIKNSIEEKNRSIYVLEKKSLSNSRLLEDNLRQMNYVGNNQKNPLMSFFSDDTLSDATNNMNNISNLKSDLNDSLHKIKNNKKILINIKSDLEDTKSDEENLKLQQIIQKKDIEQDKNEKKDILKVTKGQEANYKKLLADTEKKAKSIRTALFSLNNSNQNINFGKAYDIAKQVESATGVRAAFLLGIITVETNLGKNIGKGNWKIDMHPTRDQPVFEKLTAELGLDPDKQPVSKKAWYGYGGAMGPAQFIPSTWVGYKSKISNLTGNNPPNPWNPYDAFMAAGLLLKDNGATKGTRSSEHRAAVCYLAGCGNASKSSFQFYGNDVMKYADKYEANIDILKNNG